ncbi:protein transport Sec1a-like isoform X2 [Syzygium oleosum]|uniref:protein transport Sec1a-like isoform X2 n=1 Tax=Syzygium oleosum TaxID=219896 RepID=UPI0024BBC537|nr:protein transport Sec1a-like isoform X2 [Syzygium oleosum]
MSFSDSDLSSHGGDYKTFGQISRDRLLNEMLGTAKTGDSKSTWKVLIMDKVTLKVMSSSCKMADITDQGVSLVEDLFRRRQPLPSMDAIYFVQPSKENVIMFLSDMSGRVPLYKKAYLFFSSPVPKELINHIKCDTSVLPRIGALREVNLEYFPIDSQELPNVWYHAGKAKDSPQARDLVPSKLATAISSCLMKYKSIPNFPQKETCDLLILNRSVDLIAPVIHEWTYDAMCHDLLDMDGNKYVYEVPSQSGGQPEKKEALLENQDPIWLELRHSHIADASERLHEKMTNFVNKNKAAQAQRSSRDGSELTTRDLQKIVQALPQYGEQVDKLSLHVEIAGKINKIIREIGLRELGQLEQDLVFGDAGAKDVISFLRTKQDATPENKLRLMMIFATVYPERFEGDKASKLMQLAKLSPVDMKVISNMKLLVGSSESKSSSGSFSLKFDGQKTKNAARKDRTGEEETWQLSRFYPMIEELVENLSKGELPKREYACMNDPQANQGVPSSNTKSVRKSQAPAPQAEKKAPAQSMRSRRTATWARSQHSDDGYSSDSVLKHASSDFRKMGQRIFVFIIGGATRSELRACHKLTTKLRREVILGSTSLDDPPQYLTKLKLLSESDLSLEGVRIM